MLLRLFGAWIPLSETESSSDYVLNKKELKRQPLLCIKNNAGADPTVWTQVLPLKSASSWTWSFTFLIFAFATLTCFSLSLLQVLLLKEINWRPGHFGPEDWWRAQGWGGWPPGAGDPSGSVSLSAASRHPLPQSLVHLFAGESCLALHPVSQASPGPGIPPLWGKRGREEIVPGTDASLNSSSGRGGNPADRKFSLSLCISAADSNSLGGVTLTPEKSFGRKWPPLDREPMWRTWGTCAAPLEGWTGGGFHLRQSILTLGMEVGAREGSCYPRAIWKDAVGSRALSHPGGE